MHLKSYPKLVRSELRLEAAGVQTSPQRSGLLVSQQRALLKTRSSNHGNISGGRLPFSIISANMVSHGNTTNGVVSSNVMSVWLKASSSPTLQLPPPPLGCENNMLRLYQTTGGDADAPPDVWTVIKPGHVREKIAIFASEGGWTDGAEGSEQVSTSSSGGRDRTPAVYTNHTAMSGLTRAVKAKGSWEENCSAKRRRRSGSNQNQSLRQDQRTWVLDPQQNTHEPSPWCSDSPQRSGSGRWGGEAVTMAVSEEEEQKVSVVEMVAFLEQRASEQRLDCKPLLALQRSSTTITLCRAPPTEVTEGSDFRGEEPESIRVADMVAKLELDYLRRRTEGELSRSNSLRRTVGRVLLATGDQGSAPPHSPSSSVKSSVTTSSSVSSLPGAQSQDGEPISCSEMVRMEAPAQPLTMPPSPVLVTSPSSLSGEAHGAGGGRGLAKLGSVRETETVALPPWPKEVEPVPGLLFLSLFPACTDPPPPLTDSGPCPLHHRLLFDPEPAPLQPRPPAVSSSPDTGSQSEERSSGQGDRGQEGQVGGSAPGSTAAPLGRRPSVSQDFLEMRQRLQQLLEPQQYLAVLPHHLLVKIFLLLPTQSLAALKCTCHYFKFVIENYGVRPADSLWVLDPRYRDDPCKQCKKRYNRGDVSLCRWHHKPYCQALPYGPGYWMCCHGAHRDTPGCNVGLHDNRWVPAFHSISAPIYRRSHDDD